MLTHPQLRHSHSPFHTSLQLAYNTDLHVWDHVAARGPEVVRISAGAMQAHGDIQVNGIMHDYPWASLDGKTLIDIGGGTGSFTVSLAKKFPNLKYVVQDRSEVVPFARENVKAEVPQQYADGRIIIEAHDFFSPQPQTGDDKVYAFRWIIHDWPDEKAIEILRSVAQAASPQARVLIIDAIIDPGAVKSTGETVEQSLATLDNAATYRRIPPPPFLPSNFGDAARYVNGLSVHMTAILNGGERTMTELKAILHTAGLEILKVYHLRSSLSIIEAQRISN